MDMESVIGEQSINHRRKPIVIAQDPGAKAFFAFSGFNRPSQSQNEGLRKRNSFIAPRIHSPRLRASGESAAEGMRLFFDTPRANTLAQASIGGSEAPAGEISLFVESLSSSHDTETRRLNPRIKKAIAYALSALALASVAATLILSWEATLDLSGFSFPEDQNSIELILDSLSGRQDVAEENAALPALPLTLSFSTYTVARNDTLDQIARRYSVRLDTLISLNSISNVRRIQAGAVLKIPNIDGVIHTVKKGESLSGIASSAKLSIIDIIDANDLASQTISPGQNLFLPGARLASNDLKKALGTLIAWPVQGRLSSYFGYRANPFTGVRQFHNGLDIVAQANTPAKAAMDGRVAETGYSAVFGNFVILSHADSYQTLYAHLNAISVRTGQNINQGTTVGLIGSTGYSTGTHLHFGLFKNGVGIDPLKMLGK
ncbi:MAG TPA: M23 family peptidase [Spirochaetaceae bacterium]|jgi:murein DD-endopeptidase MepM/ murein hydrolase activator NlpD|nr:M23 family peptidase [Spirochaetaceae bacterium]